MENMMTGLGWIWMGDFLKNSRSDRQNSFMQGVDISKLQTVVCSEAVLDVWYQFLAGLIHNQTFRKECQRSEQRAQYHQIDFWPF